MTEPLPSPLAPLARDPGHAAVLLDFDGTLAEIVVSPELARPAVGAVDAVRAAVGRFAVVAVVSGRPTSDVRALLGVDGVRYLGLYGLEAASGAGAVPAAVSAAARVAAAAVAGTRVEEKGGSVAVHYRQAPDPAAARAALLSAFAEPPAGFEAIEGKMVVELVPAGRPRKGGAVRRVLEELRPSAAMYAGDDTADLEAFGELERQAAAGAIAVARVAVTGPETPGELSSAADIRVAGPAGMVRLLAALAAAAG
ncbi:MAG TPA: trehalose-phosphatase [Actinomycetota bacterium]